MEEKIYDCYCCLVDELLNAVEEYEFVNCIVKYKDASEIIKTLLASSERTSIDGVYIGSPEYDGYTDEYLISIDRDFKIYCEKAKNEDKYIGYDSAIVFIHNDCHSCIVKNNCAENPTNIAFGFVWEENEKCDEKEECDKFSGEINLIVDRNDNVVGFEYNYSDDNGTTMYSYRNVNTDMVYEILRNFIN